MGRAPAALLLVVFLAAGLLGLAAPAMAAPPQRVALVVGNSAYRNLPRLANPANDAALVGATLKELGFELVGGGIQLDLDKAGFTRAVQQFGAALQTADVGLFYYAGHGLQVQGTNWLVPVGADPTGPQDLDFQMVDAELVLKQMQYAKTRLNIVILDACRNNPFAGRGLRAAQGGLAEMRAPQGALIAYATQPGNVARDGEGANSPFSAALARTLRRPGLDVFRLFNEVGLAVKRETGGDQQPWVSTSPIDGDFYFAGPAAGAAPADAELMFWQSIAGSREASDYAAYLRQYPNGRFAALAQDRAAPRPAPPAAPAAPAPTPGPGSWQQALAALRPTPPAPRQPERARAPSLFLASVRALNAVVPAAEHGYNDYAETFDPDRGPTGRERSARLMSFGGPEAARHIEELRASLAQAAGDTPPAAGYAETREMYTPLRWVRSPPPPEPLAVLVPRFLAAHDRLAQVLAEARPYFDQENYRDDRFAGARAMHPGIVGAYRDYLVISDRLTRAVQTQAAGERETFLSTAPAGQRLVSAAILRSLTQARRLLGFVAASLDGGRDPQSIDQARLAEEIGLYERAIGEIRPFGPPANAQAGFSMAGFRLQSLLERSDRLLATGKYLLRTVRDRQKLERTSFSFRTGAEYDIFARFNDLVGSANLILNGQ